jgi:hypothetical protein
LIGTASPDNLFSTFFRPSGFCGDAGSAALPADKAFYASPSTGRISRIRVYGTRRRPDWACRAHDWLEQQGSRLARDSLEHPRLDGDVRVGVFSRHEAFCNGQIGGIEMSLASSSISIYVALEVG